ncbi:unnamed protein product [Mytilus edulis]|uniref:Uncharacterized protein n=1 Tax=Mytilus edulis TaxID=6550 RepID=A0A8S3S6N0_MYTED|nr:unnamed protein product [Mytilus edulis]
MKKFASDVQVFLGTREMNIIVAKEIETITRTINAALHFKIEAELDLNISSLLNQADAMGKILLQEIPTNLRFKDAKIYQAQKQSSLSPERGFHELRLQIKQKLKILRKKNEIIINVTGCLILPNGHVLISVLRRFDEIHSRCLIEYNKEGNHINDIRLSKDPFDLTLIDSDRIAITYGKGLLYKNIISNFFAKSILRVEIKNITHGSSNKILVNNSCWGISHQDGRLYVIVEEEGILVVDVSGNILNSLRINTCNAKYISTSKHIICYSDDVENSVHCCNMDGQEMWVFQLNSISICPAGLSVVHNNDICVVCCTSNNITLIHCDGTESKTLVTADDGLNEVKALHYDKHSKTLLVCDKTNATLYKVV